MEMIEEILHYGENQYFFKFFIHPDQCVEEVQKTDGIGYGCEYSHPQHLKVYYDFKIKNFKDMDKALDKREFLRGLYEENEKIIKINIGNICTKDQLENLELLFNEAKEHKITIMAKIRSASRKYIASFEDFKKELDNKEIEVITEQEDQRQFNTHIMEFAKN